jgi:RNA polymerase sigma-70 factor (ECF subfamily)
LIFREAEDRDLILRARQGDVEAYNVLVSRWEKRVYNYLLRSVRNREDALDLCQETFLKAYRNLGKLDNVERFPQWLFRIAHNEGVSLFRRNRLSSSDDIPEGSEGLPISFGGSPISPADLTLAVAQALEALTPEQRETVVLKVYQGFKFHEIAEIISCPVSTVKSRLYTAFEVLKAALAPVDRLDS